MKLVSYFKFILFYFIKNKSIFLHLIDCHFIFHLFYNLYVLLFCFSYSGGIKFSELSESQGNNKSLLIDNLFIKSWH